MIKRVTGQLLCCLFIYLSLILCIYVDDLEGERNLKNLKHFMMGTSLDFCLLPNESEVCNVANILYIMN